MWLLYSVLFAGVYNEAFKSLVGDFTTKFLKKTISVLKQMLLSEMPLFRGQGWIHLKKSMLISNESALPGCPISSFKRPVLLFCANRNVKIFKEKVTIKVD